MGDNKQNRLLGIVSLICAVYLLLTAFYYHIDKYLTGIVFIFLTLLIPITFIAIVVYAVKGVVQISSNRSSLNFKFCLPVIIALVTLVYTIFSPWRVSSEILERKIILRACFEGTQNQASIKFRQDKTFEINWTGVFGYDEWFTGIYHQEGDTFYLKYKTEKPFRFGDTIINNGRSLITINKLKKDSHQYFVPFSLGNCKGLN